MPWGGVLALLSVGEVLAIVSIFAFAVIVFAYGKGRSLKINRTFFKDL